MKRYSIIYADPPWSYRDKGSNGSVSKVYNTMSVQEICRIPVQKISNDNSILFIWGTYPNLPEVFKVIDSWGFTYKTLGFQWIKQNRTNPGIYFGLGHWTRANTEPLFIATKGHISRVRSDISQVVMANIGSNSEKPSIFREKILELMGDLPRIELFARHRVCGWDCWEMKLIQTYFWYDLSLVLKNCFM